ncbi:MAG: radical SAM protein [Candidatus Sumerlaeaceae bacterium]|nr:radical SAM protein [Candidatus Sumerlaeaceae bacterium]
MPSVLREAARWGKRQHLRWRLDRASGERVKWANSDLNWREFWHKKTQLESYPRLLQVATNWTCNLKCNFCRLTLDETQDTLKQLPKNELEISPRVFETVMELMPFPETITLTPLGEPLLYTKLGRILERHREIGSRNLAMTTNANLINDDRARMIVEGGVNHLFVSIDSSDPEIYASMRVLGQLDKVEAALERINRWKDRLNSPRPTMTLASTFMERNVRQMPDLVDFAVKHKFQTYSVQLMEMENHDLDAEFLGHHVPLARDMVLETLRRAEGKPVDVRIHLAMRNLLTQALSLPERKKLSAFGEGEADNFWNGAEPDCVHGSPEGDLQSLSTHGAHLTEKCHYPWYFMLIDTDGDVRPCCWASNSFGNLNNYSFEDMWNGEHAITMREDFLRNHIPKSCQGKHCRVDLDHNGTLEV